MAPLTLLYDINYNKNISLDHNIYKYFAIPAVIHIIEEFVLNMVLMSIPLGLYIIGRTSGSIFNILYYKIVEKKDISTLNKIAITMVLISYIFMMVDLISLVDYKQVLNLFIVLLSGMTTTFYNVLAENQLKKVNNNKNNYMVRSNTIFQLSCFISFVPICGPFVKIDFSNFTYDFYIVCITSAFCAQIASINKYYILDNVNQSSLLISGLDLARRVLMFILTISLLNESYSIFDTIGYILVLIASIMMIYDSYKINIL
jgi:uncharacterized membrane protein